MSLKELVSAEGLLTAAEFAQLASVASGISLLSAYNTARKRKLALDAQAKNRTALIGSTIGRDKKGNYRVFKISDVPADGGVDESGFPDTEAYANSLGYKTRTSKFDSNMGLGPNRPRPPAVEDKFPTSKSVADPNIHKGFQPPSNWMDSRIRNPTERIRVAFGSSLRQMNEWIRTGKGTFEDLSDIFRKDLKNLGNTFGFSEEQIGTILGKIPKYSDMTLGQIKSLVRKKMKTGEKGDDKDNKHDDDPGGGDGDDKEEKKDDPIKDTDGKTRTSDPPTDDPFDVKTKIEENSGTDTDTDTDDDLDKIKKKKLRQKRLTTIGRMRPTFLHSEKMELYGDDNDEIKHAMQEKETWANHFYQYDEDMVDQSNPLQMRMYVDDALRFRDAMYRPSAQSGIRGYEFNPDFGYNYVGDF